MLADDRLRVAEGFLELGLTDEALDEIRALPTELHGQREVLELKLAVQMQSGSWNPASETARLLCLQAADEPSFFISAAYCLHETGDTLAARDWLMRGPKALHTMPVFHYNLACYLWTLGEAARARTHLKQAISMDGSLLEEARQDRDLNGIGPLA
jgi:predicted Zn-dependent protease